MSKENEKVSKIKALMITCRDYLAKFAADEQKFTDAKLSDGVTVVHFPGAIPVVGDAIMVTTDQGDMPLPDNAPDEPYVLEDGTVFSVVNGAVTVVQEAETPAEDKAEAGKEEPVTPAAAAAATAAATPKRVIKSNVEEHVFSTTIGEDVIEFDFSDVFKPFTDKIAALEKENTDLKKNFSEQAKLNVALAEQIEALEDEPATESAEKKKVLPQTDIDKMTKLERYRHFKSLEVK